MKAKASPAHGEQGFALIETIGTLAFACTALTGGLIAVYMSVAHLWLKRAVYESSICLSTSELKSNCETQLRKTTTQALPAGRLTEVHLIRERDNVETKVRWALEGPMEMTIVSKLSTPLLGPANDF